ncbi:hypothetical protein LCGC14_2364120, partial [marine sediment metagenome]
MAKLLIPTDTSQATLGFLLADGTIVGSTSQAQDFGSTGIKADVIAESTGAAGVTVDSVLLKDGDIALPADNDTITFGTGSDATILYDGTDLIINPDAVGTGGVRISGTMAVGGATIDSAVAIDTTISSTSIREGLTGTITYTGSGTGAVAGLGITAVHEGTHADSSTVSGLGGFAQANRSSGGAVSSLVGGQFKVTSGPSQSTGIDDAWGVQVLGVAYVGDKPTRSTGIQIANHGHASVTDVVALDIAPQTAGSGDTYQIREKDTTGFNVLAGDTRIGAITDPTVALDVTGAALISTTLGVTGIATLATSSTIGNLTLADGSITDSSGAISFGNENLSTTGTAATGALTVTGAILATSYGGITEANLLDKTANETITKGF